MNKQKYSGKINFQHKKYLEHGAYHWELYNNKHPMYYPIINEILKIVPFNCSVLDIGCGDGVAAYEIARLGHGKNIVKGIDNDSKAIELASEKKLPNLSFECIDIENDKFDGTCEYVISVDVIEHFENPDILVNFMCKYGKYKLIGTPIISNSKSIYRSHFREYSVAELENYVSKFMKICEIRTIELRNMHKQKREYMFVKCI